jgi:hypothetical protein
MKGILVSGGCMFKIGDKVKLVGKMSLCGEIKLIDDTDPLDDRNLFVMWENWFTSWCCPEEVIKK